jgi:hypothetical protein
VGALVFLIFWGFGFLRLSTGGMAAQAKVRRSRRAAVPFAPHHRGLTGFVLIAASPLIEKGPLA